MSIAFSKLFARLGLTLTAAWTAVSLPAADLAPPAKSAPARQLIPWPRIGEPDVAAASPEAAANLKRITVPKGFRLELWAAEPMLGNPVAFCLDEKGRVFVSETYRYRTSVLDIRHYMFMLEEDMACRTVDDRIEMMRRNFAPEFGELGLETEVVRLLEDRDGNGKADFSSIYADGFNSVLDGIASGVLARKGKVYFTNIPHLWELEGIDAQGKALRRESLSRGYGVRFSFTGHDMHGLAFGPDGKLYFSIGDRGATVVTKELNLLAYPDEGAVFRCNPDGSELEVVHRGLRNPQELAFDNYGNLFTGDNDFDHGDEERLVYVVEGGDSGWRVGYQHSRIGFELVPWKLEHIWLAHHSRQADYNGVPLANRVADTGVRPAAYLPPVSNIENGPSGMAFYPGTGLPARYDQHFFLTHFKGNIANSKIQAFSVKPKGAAFELDHSEAVVGNLQPTDVDFGPDGAMYFADWGEGWARTRKGRIYRVVNEEAAKDPVVRETRKLLGEGFERRATAGLLKLLGHADRRVRQEAHFELAARGSAAVKGLTGVAQKGSSQFARLHAIWALGMIGRHQPGVLRDVVVLLKDKDAEVRAQAAKVVGDGKYGPALNPLIAAVKDASPRVRFFAANSLGKLRRREAIPAILEMLRANNDQDAYLRHGGVMALVGINHVTSLLEAAKDKSAAVRMAVLLGFRQLGRPEFAQFLQDKDPRIVIEAARAVNDAPIDAAMRKLAVLADDPPALPEKYQVPLLLRALNANLRAGTPRHAESLAKFAAQSRHPAAMRAEALNLLGEWASPHPRDRVMGVYRPLKPRATGPAANALKPVLTALLKDAPDDVRIAAAETAVALGVQEAGTAMQELVADGQMRVKVRTTALTALAGLKSPKLNEAIILSLEQKNPRLRAAALNLVGHLGPAPAVRHLTEALRSGSVDEQQQALGALARVGNAAADGLLLEWMNQLTAGKVRAELQLDVLEAARKRDTEPLKAALQRQAGTLKADDELAEWRVALAGGDAAEGEKIFRDRSDVQCLRCHKLNGNGGEAGPDLTGIGAKHPREHLLEAIVSPSAKIAPGFETIQVEAKGDLNYSGLVKKETADELVLFSAEDGNITIAKKDILSRRQGLSGMPAGLHQMLGAGNLRDLVEYLAGLR